MWSEFEFDEKLELLREALDLYEDINFNDKRDDIKQTMYQELIVNIFVNQFN